MNSIRIKTISRWTIVPRAISVVSVAMVSAGCITLAGCQLPRPSMPSFIPTSVFAKKTPDETTRVADSSGTRGSGSRLGRSQRLPDGAARMVGYVTGKTEDLDRAREIYQQANSVFEKAKAAPKEEQAALYSEAAELFADVQFYAPPALVQDSLYMQGESQFMANQLTDARDTFEKLQKEYPRNRHTDRTAARLFAIGKYWIDVDHAGGEPWMEWLNPLDGKTPFLDASGHAIKVLDQIRFDDPTGRLADDATMAAAAEHIRQGEYDLADEFLTDLRETFTDSDHLFLAHLLGIRCKLEIYRGPDYSARSLEEARRLIEQTRTRFPNQTREKQYAEMLARASAEVAYHQAQKLAHRASFNEKQGNYLAAREYYQRILQDHSTTPQAELAKERLAKIKDYPDKPAKRLAFLSSVFPDARVTKPFETVEDEARRLASERAVANQSNPLQPGAEIQGNATEDSGAEVQDEASLLRKLGFF